MRKTWVQSLGCEDPLEKGKACTPVFWPGEFQRLSLHFTMHSWPEFQGPTRGAAVHLPVYMNGAAAGVQAHPAQLYWYMVVLVKRWVCVCVCLFFFYFLELDCDLSHFSCIWVFVTPWTVAHQAPLSMGFSRQECWSGLPCLQGIFLSQRSHLHLLSPALAGRFFTTSTTWEAQLSWSKSHQKEWPLAVFFISKMGIFNTLPRNIVVRNDARNFFCTFFPLA